MLPGHKGMAYGFCIAYRQPKAGEWTIDSHDDKELGVPAHYELIEEACDRVEYLRRFGFECRVMTLLSEAGDDDRAKTSGRPELT